VYNSFRALKPDQVHAWCQQNYISHRALSRAVEIRKQLYKYLRKFDHAVLSSDDSAVIRKALVAGFFANAAQLSADGSYRTVRDDKVRLISVIPPLI
jgi:ATP-dependent RNA helicase DDX35